MTEESLPRPSDKWIPWYFVLFFAVLSCIFGGFAWVAVTTHTGTVTDGAYQKGLAYNGVIEKAERQAALGYRPALVREGDRLVFTLAGADGAPVAVETATVWFYRPANARRDLRAAMAPAGGGRFEYAPDLPAAGLWEVRILARTAQGPYQYTKRMVFE